MVPTSIVGWVWLNPVTSCELPEQHEWVNRSQSLSGDWERDAEPSPRETTLPTAQHHHAVASLERSLNLRVFDPERTALPGCPGGWHFVPTRASYLSTRARVVGI